MKRILLCLSFAVGATIAQAAERPNVVLVMADDQNYVDSGCYGNELLKTPNIDRLARDGMRFTHCFTATAMCSPTRQQLYTGIFPVRNGAYPNHSQVKPGTKSFVHYFRDLGYRVGLSGKVHVGPRKSFPFERLGRSPNFKKMEEFIERNKTQPYFLVVTSHSPHSPWKAGDASQYPPQKIEVPPFLVDTPKTREALSRYYAEITDFDRELGRTLDLVEKSGQSDDTIVIYTSEQGSSFPFAKWTCYDMGLRTALVVRWPARVKPGTVTDAMVQYVDILPTLLDAVGHTEPIARMDGKSFLDVLEGKQDDFREAVFGVHTTQGIIQQTRGGYPIRSVRTRRYKYIWNIRHTAAFSNIVISRPSPIWRSWVEAAETDKAAAERVRAYERRPEIEFYDLENDPYELHNLADDPQYAAKMKEMRRMLDGWMKQQGDKGLETELATPQHRSIRDGAKSRKKKKNAKK